LVSDADVTLDELLTHSQTTIVGQMPVLARLRELRVRAGLTQAELADKAHVARTTVIRLEGGNPEGRPTTLRRLARALSTSHHRVTIDEMIGD
jgi:DNA-binding XRE family transcriptional regulator